PGNVPLREHAPGGVAGGVRTAGEGGGAVTDSGDGTDSGGAPAGGRDGGAASAPVALPVARVLPMVQPAHLDRVFDYRVPSALDQDAQPGVRVRARFSGRLIDGYLLERADTTEHEGRLGVLERVLSPLAVLPAE